MVNCFHSLDPLESFLQFQQNSSTLVSSYSGLSSSHLLISYFLFSQDIFVVLSSKVGAVGSHPVDSFCSFRIPSTYN